MIAALSGWLKQIIVMILIATFVDLILPGKSMGRYVKVVVSLFLLLAILTPIIQLLRSDFALEFDQVLKGEEVRDTEMIPVHGVIRSGQDLRGKQEDQALNVLEERLEHVMQEEAEAQFPIRIQDIQVIARIDSKGEAQLQEISILASALDEPMDVSRAEGRDWAESDAFSELEQEIARIQPIEPIEPVEIDIRFKRSLAQVQNVQPSPLVADEGNSDAAARLSKTITAWLAQRWSVPHSIIRIRIAE